MNFEELSDDEWLLVAALVSDDPPIRLNRRGRPRAEPRVVTNAVLWILTTGESWSRLPARYPSGPTCRRRFDDWHVNGTLAELVQLLSQRGRTFLYIPDAPTSALRDAVAAEETADDDGLPSVFWKSPEAWQAPGHVAGGMAQRWPVDPIESMTRQLSRSVSDEAPFAGETGAAVAKTPPKPVARAPREETPAVARNPLWISGGAQFTQVAEWRGCVMHLTVQPSRNRTFRASVEIVKDGKRVERSGLVGPPFTDSDEARHYAFDWAREWIERESRGSASLAHVDNLTVVPAAAVTTVVTRPAAADVVTRPAPPVSPAMPANGRGAPPAHAPVHRFAPTGGLPSLAADSTREPGGSAERRSSVGAAVAPRLRSHVGS